MGKWICGFASQHSESLILFCLAMAATMRKQLPWPLNRVEILEWSYEWLRDGLLTFVSLRGPAPHVESTIQASSVVDAKGNTVSSVTESKTSGPVPPALAPEKETPPTA